MVRMLNLAKSCLSPNLPNLKSKSPNLIISFSYWPRLTLDFGIW
jgi:hypothetical protein